MKRSVALLALLAVVLAHSHRKVTKTVKMVNKYKLSGDKDKKPAKSKEEEELEKKLEGLTDQQKVDLYPNLFYWEHEVNQEDVNQQAAANEKAQKLFQANPDGSDEHKEIKDGALSVQVSFNKKEEKMQEVHMYLNDEAVYFLDEKQNGYRGVMGSIQLSDVYSPEQDEVRMGQCCENVGTVASKLIGDINTQTTYYCFVLNENSAQQEWKICALDESTADEWRQAIILQVIIKGLKSKGIYGLDALLKFQKAACKNPTGWSYSYQSRWPCLCPEGENQSPINIETKNLKDEKTPTLSFRYAPTSSLVLDVLKWQTNSNGDYGQIIYKSRKRKRTLWNAQEIRFKFRSEHKIDGKDYPAEMQIFHTNDDGRMALSFFISDQDDDLRTTKLVALQQEKEDKDSKREFNSNIGMDFFKEKGEQGKFEKIQKENDAFLEQFSYLMWPRRRQELEGTQKCIDASVNITKILDNDSVSNSWFMYMGSDTQPPCTEDVQWFIMRDPLIVSSVMLNTLKDKAIGTGADNRRDAFPMMDREVVYHEQCKKFEIPPQDLPEKIPDAQYVQAETTQHVYGIVHPETKTVFSEDDKPIELTRGDDWKVTLKQMEEKELKETHPQVVESLRSQLGNWLVENQGRIQAEKRRIKLQKEKEAKMME